jgi:SAM-dependent methyltransferase
MPLEKDSIDTAATTWTMCTIPDPVKALQEVRRVLKPDGLLIFVEHGRALEPKVVAEPADAVVEAVRRRLSSEPQDRRPRPTRRLQHRRAADGLRQGPRPMAFMYEGRARLS